MFTDEQKEAHKKLTAPLVKRRASENREWAQDAINHVLFNNLCLDSGCSPFCTSEISGSAKAKAIRRILVRILESEYEAGVSITELVRDWSSENLAKRIMSHPDADNILEQSQEEHESDIYRYEKTAADKFAAFQRGEIKY